MADTPRSPLKDQEAENQADFEAMRAETIKLCRIFSDKSAKEVSAEDPFSDGHLQEGDNAFEPLIIDLDLTEKFKRYLDTGALPKKKHD